MNTNIGYIYLFWDKYTQSNADSDERTKRHKNREYKLREILQRNGYSKMLIFICYTKISFLLKKYC